MRTCARLGIFIAAFCFLGGGAAGQETPEDIRRLREADERNIDRICAPARKEYEARRAQHERFAARMRDPGYRRSITSSPEEAQRAIRDSRAQVDEARETYCECLRNNYAKAGQLMPSELERLCRGELETPDPDVIPPPEPPGPRTGYPEAPAGERSAACARERARYVQARQRYINAGQPAGGKEAERAFRDVPAAGFAYCDCMRRLYKELPLEVAMFCSGFDEMRAPWPPLGPGVPPPDDKPPKAGAGADQPCAAEFQKYNGLYRRLEAMPRESPERPELQRQTDAAFRELCECLRVKAPDKWRALCGDPPSAGPSTGTPGASGSKPSKPVEPPPPPPPPVAPPPPGAGPGSGAGSGSGGAPVPPEPRAPAPPAPTEVSRVLAPGTTATVAFSNVVHSTGSPEPHVASAATGGVSWCRLFVAIQLLTFLQVTETSFSMRFANQPVNLECPGPPNGPVTCVGRFSGLFGLAREVVVRATGVTFGGGRVQGRLEVNSAASPFSANFSGALATP